MGLVKRMKPQQANLLGLDVKLLSPLGSSEGANQITG